MTFSGTLRRNVARSLARYRNVRLAGIAGLYARSAMMHLPIRRKPRSAAARPERIVVSLTTIPARTAMMGPALRSLLDQDTPADRIMLCLPRHSRRSGAPYPEPGTLNLPEGVDVLRCEDQGPATKLLPALKAEPEALIVVADDDVIYPRDFLSTLLQAHRRRPEAALGLRGACLREGVRFPDLWHELCSGIDGMREVDILFGTWGFMVPAARMDAAVHDFSGHAEAVRWVDDVWISGHLARLGIPRLVVPARSFPIETLAAFRQALTYGPNRSGENDAQAIAAFADHWGVSPPGG